MTAALLFPGQGSQRPGMLAGLHDHAEVRSTMAEAAEVLAPLIPGGIHSLHSEAALAGTLGAQLSLVVAGVASGRTIMAEIGPPSAVAGHSVGAFTAAVVAGVLTLTEALQIVHLRAETMIRLFPTGYGMAAVTGLSPLAARSLAESLAGDRRQLWVANVNSDDQTVFAGNDAGLARLEAAAGGAGARAVRRLAVAVPSHGAPLAPVVDVLAVRLATVEDRPNPLPSSSNVSGRLLRTAAAVRHDLAVLTAYPVQWRDVVAILVESGVDTLVQAQPGRVLAALATAQHPDVAVAAVEDVGVPELRSLMRRSSK